MAKQIQVEVAFATIEKQTVIPLRVEKDACVHQVIYESGILEEYTEINLETANVGIFGRQCKLDKTLVDGDRVEIYRPLIITPMDARRKRAVKK